MTRPAWQFDIEFLSYGYFNDAGLRFAEEFVVGIGKRIAAGVTLFGEIAEGSVGSERYRSVRRSGIDAEAFYAFFAVKLFAEDRVGSDGKSCCFKCVGRNLKRSLRELIGRVILQTVKRIIASSEGREVVYIVIIHMNCIHIAVYRAVIQIAHVGFDIDRV